MDAGIGAFGGIYMKLVTNPMINGDVVFKVCDIGNLEVYQVNGESSEIETLYFVQNKKVLKILNIKVDSDQVTGYISECEFESVPE